MAQGLPISVWNGTTEQTGAITVWDGTQEVTPLSVSAMPPGYPSATDMLARSAFYIAYNGGSADWPEGTLRAYTQSVAWGMPAIELSLGRSIDGVFFMLRDRYLDRTSLGTETTDLEASLMTWDEIQQYQVNQHGTPRPYCQLTDVLDSYLSSHVCVIDIRFATPFYSEFWDILAQYPDFASRVIIKARGADPASATQAHTHGCLVIGMYSQADAINGSGAQWDAIGMEVPEVGDVNPAAWTNALSYGKPVIGYVCSNTAMIDKAFAAGATGVFVSGVKDFMVTPKIYENKRESTGAVLPSDILLPSDTLLPSNGSVGPPAIPSEFLLPNSTVLPRG